jgi:alpha-1,6-mannosyltransferase
MSMEFPAIAGRRRILPDSRLVLLMAVLAGAVIVQIAIALVFGTMSASARDTWRVSLPLFALLASSGGLVLWAVWHARSVPGSPTMLTTLALTGLLMRLPYFGAGPMLEDDHFRYLLDGAMVANGFSPYALSPQGLLEGSDGAPVGLVASGRHVIVAINFPDLRSVYPGTAQFLFALAHWLMPWDMDGIRVIVFGAEIITALLLWRVLKAAGHCRLGLALYWCNPLMAFSLTGQAHIDAALVPAVFGALLAGWQQRGVLAGIALGLAVGIKLWPVLLAPLLARLFWPRGRILISFALALGLTSVILCAPLIRASLSPNAGLAAYAGGWSINNAPYAWLSYAALHLFEPGRGEIILRLTMATAGMVISLLLAWKRPADPRQLFGAAALVAAAVFYLSPAQFPWYAAWFLPLAIAGGGWCLAAGSVGLPVYFLFFPLAAAGMRDVHGYGLAFFHLLPVLLAGYLAYQASLRGAMSWR